MQRSKICDLSKEELQNLCDSSSSLSQIETEYHVAHKTLVRILNENNIDLIKLKSKKNIRDDLTGKNFGWLTALKIDETKQKGNTYYICRCKCGNIISVIGSHLKNGHSTSCGCKKIELIKNRSKKYNLYDLSREYGIGYTTNTNTPFYFDKEDYEIIKDFTWRDNGYGYMISACQNGKIFMHRLVTSCKKGFVVDHINHNPADNRKDNLRICTPQENQFNKITPSNNTSGYKGIRQTPKNKWNARIKINDKSINLGTYNTIEEAIQARKDAEIKYFGEFRYKEEFINDKL